MWGTLVRQEFTAEPYRFIPTHVGNTFKKAMAGDSSSVHPHACGEHMESTTIALYPAGSSPRMWGTRCRTDLWRHQGRFIPTHVGNTSYYPPYDNIYSVHPHACGEHSKRHAYQGGKAGSSPRMWGTLDHHAVQLMHPRFIPTHVGNTAAFSAWTSCVAVHPHACGEHVSVLSGETGFRGSSPRMWGTHLGQFRGDHAVRFIPTHVGNTNSSPSGKFSPPVHPHACGEHTPGRSIANGWPGSSPRMWGTPVYLSLYLRMSNGAVHPHACGEHKVTQAPYCLYSGSSPRMWGTRGQLVHRPRHSRFIPTHVGNTAGG